jgi:CheY-like chemotaxis protein/3'-phosphoadenosine 5'-phosphosulfate sulfotransferase (PAPS reductase)/FAD synthetase
MNHPPRFLFDAMLQTIDLSSLRPPHINHQHVGARAREVAVTPEIAALLASDAVVAIGESGGKDSVACALAVARHLDAIGHTGPRILVHSDLGRVEWKDSGPVCERLAAYLGWELLTVQRQAGDMLARWEKRWSNNVERYRDLSCVRLILPWSTPSLRFFTSELKSSVIFSALKKRFPTQDIVNVTGVRRQESSSRSKMPISAPLASLSTKGRTGITWNAIIEWSIDEVFTEIAAAGLALHEAYTVYGASRVSCAYCIMSTLDDLRAAANCADNHDLYREMVRLEAASTFAFQGQRWLADVAPDLLSASLKEAIGRAKAAAAQRQTIEAEIPPHLLFTSGWPTVRPTLDEAQILANVRSRVAALVGIDVLCTDAQSVLPGTMNCWQESPARLLTCPCSRIRLPSSSRTTRAARTSQIVGFIQVHFVATQRQRTDAAHGYGRAVGSYVRPSRRRGLGLVDYFAGPDRAQHETPPPVGASFPHVRGSGSRRGTRFGSVARGPLTSKQLGTGIAKRSGNCLRFATVSAAPLTPPLWTTRVFSPVTPPVGVLIVDDDHDLADALQAVLEAEGFEARTADCPACLRLIGFWIPHIVVVDIEMPIQNGFELARAMRQVAHMRLVPIIAHTSLAEEDVAREGFASGMDAYCSKSDGPSVLLALLRRVAPVSLGP